jgi:hypothetical protein
MLAGHKLVRQNQQPASTIRGVFVGKCWCGIEVQATHREAAEKLHDEKWHGSNEKDASAVSVTITMDNGATRTLDAAQAQALVTCLTEGIVNFEIGNNSDDQLTDEQFSSMEELHGWLQAQMPEL